MTELRQLFFETAAELVQKLNDEAMQLEKSPGDAETARSLRRTVHTLKGDAAACGFRELSELCHEFEDVLTLGNTARGFGSRDRVARGRCVCGLAGSVPQGDKASQHPVIARGHCPSGTREAGRRGPSDKKDEENKKRREAEPMV